MTIELPLICYKPDRRSGQQKEPEEFTYLTDEDKEGMTPEEIALWENGSLPDRRRSSNRKRALKSDKTGVTDVNLRLPWRKY